MRHLRAPYCTLADLGQCSPFDVVIPAILLIIVVAIIYFVWRNQDK